MRRFADRCHRRLADEWQRLRGYPYLRRRFLAKMGYPVDLKNPKSFNEKILVRKLYDRNPVYPIISDKIRVRGYVADILGQARSDALFPRLLGSTNRPTQDWLRGFGTGVIVKANHGSSMHRILLDGDVPDYPKLARDCRKWLQTDFGRDHWEWGYRPIPRRVLVEELLCFPNGAPADDIKFTVFDGRMHMAQFNIDKHAKFENAFVTRDWQRIDIQRAHPIAADLPPRPAQFDEMVALAEQLGQAFDYIRVDYLYTGTRFALNELTLYTGGGFTPLRPADYDLALGQMWTQRVYAPKRPHKG